MLLSRCAWHRMYYGYPRVIGLVSWRGWRLQFTDGMCRFCARRIREHWKTAAVVSEWRSGFWASGKVGAAMVGVPVLLALLLAAGPLDDSGPSEQWPATLPVSVVVDEPPPLTALDGECPETKPTAMAEPLPRRGARTPVLRAAASRSAPTFRLAHASTVARFERRALTSESP